MINHLINPIRASRRLEDLEQRLSRLWISLGDDQQWLAGDATSEALTARYREMVKDSWGSYVPEPIRDLRDRLGLNPYSPKPSLADQAMQLCYAIEQGPASKEMTDASLMAVDLERVLRKAEGAAA
ncbi:hypothetical protein SAMN05661010_02561 [Modicisalibacter muralis]|uniref:Uncharacterized protein n=1 Tax=Modicisalibacter muralis TaxID=119000 RepID=A0A1G9MXN0_9GAMM|nr:hypothetical protein [Halomonas muralis]SDL78979.1 hypothetical protein SAMN05661010_02561 [Halomonas muralis]